MKTPRIFSAPAAHPFPSDSVQPRPRPRRPRVLCAFVFSFVAILSAIGQTTVVTPLATSPDYVEKGMLVAGRSGPYRAAITTRFNDGPAVTVRPLSVEPDSALNQELVVLNVGRLGSRALPSVYGGFIATVYDMKRPAPYTTRAQLQNGPSFREDFFNLSLYVESTEPQPAGLEFSFTGALLFGADDAGAPLVVPLDKIVRASFVVATQRPVERIVRVLVRDADGGGFYVSEAATTDNVAMISLAGSKWAAIDPANLSLVGDYRAPAFRRVDHIGIYATIPTTVVVDPIPAYVSIGNIALYSFEYTLLP